MSLRVYVPCDAAALSVGADAVARAIADEIASRHLELAVVRNGSRGLFWLEPLVEVETPRGRIAYGPVTADAVAGLFDRGFHDGKPHPLGHGLTRVRAARPGRRGLSYGNQVANGALDGRRSKVCLL